MSWHVALWYWLAHAALGGSVVLAVGALALRLSRQPVRRVRIIELTLLACLVVPWLSRVPGLPHWSAGLLGEPVPVKTAEPDETPAATSFAAAGPHLLPPEQPSDQLSPPPVVAPATTLPAEAASFVETNPPQPEHSAAGVGPLPWLAWSLLVAAAYLGAVALLALRWFVGLLQLRRLHRSARPITPEVADLFHRIAGPAGRHVRLLMSERLDVPLTYGWRRPVILVPAGQCVEGDLEALRFGLAHEWSHVERQDVSRWHLATLVQFLFFWQPLFWWLKRQLRLSQDYLADALAASQTEEAEDYAAYLVAVARHSLALPVAGALGVGDRRSNLYRRIFMLLKTRQPLERRCLARWNLAAALAAVLLVLGVSAVRLDAGDAPKPEARPADKKEKADKTDGIKGTPDPDPAAAVKLEYSGRVRNKDTGLPIAGATVTVRRTLYGDPNIPEEDKLIEETKHKTDLLGKYSFTIPPEQASRKYTYIELDVEAPGYAPQKGFGYSLAMIRKNEKLGGRPFFEDVTLRPGKEIRGTVETPDGKPAAGVKVLSYSNTTKRSSDHFEYGSFADTKTDAKGQFSLAIVTPGDCALWVLPKDHAPQMRVLKPEQRGELGKFGLQPGIVLKGKVLDAKGKPLGGVYVSIDRTDRDEALSQLMVADSISRGARSDDKGEFAFKPLPAGAYQVRVVEYDAEPSRDNTRSFTRSVPPAVFLPLKATLTDGQKPEPIEVRAVPHVVIEAQCYDSKGQPRSTHECTVSGQLDKEFWYMMVKPDAKGKFTILAPHGLENARLELLTNEHGSLRHRVTMNDKLQRGREVKLGTLDHDIKGIEIVRYTAPILLIKVADKEGKKPKDVALTGLYPEDPNVQEGRFIVKKGLQSEILFEEQEDGRFRSEMLLPDEEVTITTHADGYKDSVAKFKLKEGETKEVTILVEKQ